MIDHQKLTRHLAEAIISHPSKAGHPPQNIPFSLPDFPSLQKTGLIPLTAKYFQKSQLSQAILQYSRELAFRNLTLYGEMLRLVQAAKQHDLLWLPWKGPALALELFGDTALRNFNDLDFLVGIDELDVSVELMLSLGYQLSAPHQHYPKRLPLDSRCSWEFFHPHTGLNVELSVKLIPLSSSHQQLCEMLARSQNVNQQYQQLSPEDLLLSLCVHGSKHGWERPAWIIDIFCLILKYPELHWETVLARAHKYAQSRHLAYAFLTLQHMTAINNLPPKIETWAQQKWNSKARLVETPEQEIQLLFQLHPPLDIVPKLVYLLTPSIHDWVSIGAQSIFNPKLWCLRPLRLLKKIKLHR